MMKNLVAGVVHANCTCCTEAQELIHHVQLGPTRMLCARTGHTYLDRGDGLYQPDGLQLAPVAQQVAGEIEARGAVPPPSETPSEASDLLSDRPARTADKTRITLERATFANEEGA